MIKVSNIINKFTRYGYHYPFELINRHQIPDQWAVDALVHASGSHGAKPALHISEQKYGRQARSTMIKALVAPV